MYKKWTEQDFDQIIELTKLGYTAREISNLMQCSEDTVKRYKVKLGLSKTTSNNRTDYIKYLSQLEKLGIEYIELKGIKGNSLFKCKSCNNTWKARLWDVCDRQQTCLGCTPKNKSKIADKWLDELNVPMREYRVPGTKYIADGFDPQLNTLYEFLGDYWHGNLEKYSATAINTKVGVSFEQLFIKTAYKLKAYEQLGYTVVYIWESDYNCCNLGSDR